MFEQFDLDSELLANVKALGYKKPTSIQDLVIPQAMTGKDILASAPTGTGKTAAFLLPIAQHLLDYPRTKPGFPRVLILTPTRELAIQIGEDSENLTKLSKIKTGVITGGVNYGSHNDILNSTTDILVATPGRLLEYIENEQFDAREIEILVLDEADRMLDLGFSEAINRIVGEARWRKQTMLFSATLESTGVIRFAKEVLTEPEFLEATPSRKEKAKIHQWIHLADNASHKLDLLVNTLKQEGVNRTVVFANKRETVQYLSGKLYAEELPCVWLEGKMPQDKRNQAIERFKNGEVKVLVATDVAARGLDIDDITHVINFDMPRQVDIYVHRIGRTGRAGSKGTAISLIEAHDMGVVGKIERYQNERLQRRIINELRPKNKEAKVASKKAKVKRTTSQKKAKAKKQSKKKAKKSKSKN
ncbi:ATP-dependent RNA helicase SrmB [Colwellia sp. 4_MG-2023]|jgi:ATP-dependent RNA helicase SrmB|uniref:ATP-dependent RNA helicase SrmB n=1 Tax=unclassified Colwellia TaxID=196834 RepID=UPI001C080AAB|nr:MULTISPECIES: ATP-dependent RNA helicase SrmB [unclassified Colwellia]MBU2923797.1 ATP-dependent RNA helicase SrmB [Colwellia sp. C2M11]MDO6488183.1 ATP-dependent RNA helicase SrmB [Colwellia sp. 6_MG-2023]MDO6508668.1 ATP-dependent RNA helicase SrmB [Colwellia sp. 5_MG-2023]MDO6557318.1 ATP-dependent RNA helicase SrmB [Colwellia sp. 4_MG-2023]MDO6651873.1 ATP-dependent RNA helicase SrmB [Colwellia sp. 3_MG-2023]